MPLSRLREFLDSHQVRYLVISHSVAYTAQEIAASVHVPGKELAKTVIVRINGTLAMAVVPASSHVDLDRLRQETGTVAVDLASERDFKHVFPDCETGAMPPFGNLYGMPVFVDASLSKHDQITFNAGTHRELMRMAWADLARLVKPTVLPLAEVVASAA